MVNHEKALRLLHQNASAVIDAYDEALAVMFAIAWQPSLGDDLPFGTAVFKRDSEQEIKPELLLSCVRQTAKLGTHLISKLGAWTSKLQTDAGQVRKLQEEVNDLKNRLSRYEAVEATETA